MLPSSLLGCRCVWSVPRERKREVKIGPLLLQGVQHSGKFMHCLPVLTVSSLSANNRHQWLHSGSQRTPPLPHPPVWMLSDPASAPPDSAPWRTAPAATTATSGWTVLMASTGAVSSCVCSRWRPSRTTPPCTTSSCSVGESSRPRGQPTGRGVGLQKSKSQGTDWPRPALRVWGNRLEDWKRSIFKVGRTLRESLVSALTMRERPLNHCQLTLEFPNCVLWCNVNCFVTIGCYGPKAWGRLCRANHLSKKGRGGSEGMVKFCRWSPSSWGSHTPSDVDNLQCKKPFPVERLGPVICSKARPLRAGDATPFYRWQN